MCRGFVLGKFLPPHQGHVYLCDFARNYADDLTILVCSLDRDPIPGHLRHAWMTEMFPRCRVLHLHNNHVPQEPSEHPDFWSIWRSIVHSHHPEPLDFVFASETYGHRLAEEVGARFVPVDIDREVVPISGTEVRDRPFLHWRDIPAAVRPYFLKRVCVFGPESTGKSTLALRLAEAYETTWVPEYGRIYTDHFGTRVTVADLLNIVRGHRASEKAASKIANRILIEDTDPYLTLVWSDMLLHSRDPALVAAVEAAPPADLYLLTDIDVPWVNDGTRSFGEDHLRRRFLSLCEGELAARGMTSVTLKGDWDERSRTAIAAIDALLRG